MSPLARRPRGDEGAAALEFGLVLVVLLSIVALVSPLAYAFYEKAQLERAVGRAVRFAASRPEDARVAADGTTIKPSFRPTASQVLAELNQAYVGSGTVTADGGGFVRVPQGNCPNGEARTITAHATISLGPFGQLLSAIGVGNNGTKTLVASSTACEE